MTPQLQQAIKLLQLSNLELTNFLQQEIEQNPLIEWDESFNRTTETSATTDEAKSETADDTDAPQWREEQKASHTEISTLPVGERPIIA